MRADFFLSRITEEVLHESIEARTEQLIALRELGPPDLVHILKQPIRNPGKHVRTETNHLLDSRMTADNWPSRLEPTIMSPVSMPRPPPVLPPM